MTIGLFRYFSIVFCHPELVSGSWRVLFLIN